MSAHKHTPGPWNYLRRSAGGRTIICSDVSPVDVCVVSEAGKLAAEIDANTRLVASAPDSHAANVMFVESMDRFCGIEPDWDDDRIYDELPSSGLANAYFAARAAIKKATGGNNP